MRRGRFSEDQIIGILKEAESGVPVLELCRSGMEVSDARRLRSLEKENRRPKHLLAEEKLDNHALKIALGKE